MVKSSGTYLTDRVTFRTSNGRLRSADVVFGARSKAEARSVEGARKITETLRRRRSEGSRGRYGDSRPRRPRSSVNLDRVVFDRKRRPRNGSSMRDKVSRVLENDPKFKENRDKMDEIMNRGSDRRSPRPSRRSPPRGDRRGRGGERRALRRRDGRGSSTTLSKRFSDVSRRH